MKETIIQYTPVFEANKRAYESGLYRFIGNEGSSRSSKSYSLAQLMNIIAYSKKKEITVVSPSLPHLKRGAMKDVLDTVKEMGIYREDNHNKTDNILRFPRTGSYIEFFGTEEEGKLRGPGRDILWLNEMNLINHSAYTQLALRTRDVIFGDWNPADEDCYVYDLADKPGNKKIHSTYLNNLQFLTKEQINEIEALKDVDENLWRVFGLGLRGSSSELIYTHYKLCSGFPVCEEVSYGLDFGFNHPSVLTKVGILDGAIYVQELLYESRLTATEMAEIIKMHGITDRCEIICDSARPESIEELNRAGLWATPTNKSATTSKGYVYESIQWLKGRPLYITENSINLLKEIKAYKWKKDKNGNVLDEPVKVKDDGMDSMRYAAYGKFSQPQIIYAGATY